MSFRNDNEMNLTTNNICRACLISSESFTYILSQNVSPKMYWFCTTIEIQEDDIPRNLCNDCYELLKKFSDFKMTCMKSQNTLLTLKSKSKNRSKKLPETMELKNSSHVSPQLLELSEADPLDVNFRKSENVPTIMELNNIELLQDRSQYEKNKNSINEPEVMESNNIESPKLFQLLQMGSQNVKSKISSYIPVYMGPKNMESSRLFQLLQEGQNVKLKKTTTVPEIDKLNNIQIIEEDKSQESFIDESADDGFSLEGNSVTAFVQSSNGVSEDTEEHLHNDSISTSSEEKSKTQSMSKPEPQRDIFAGLTLTKNLNSFSCDICNRRFVNPERFEAHKLGHEGIVSDIRCVPCNKTFSLWSTLARHNQTKHKPISLKDLTCTTCGKVFNTPGTLQSHLRAHGAHGEQATFVCEVCGKVCKTKSNLKDHLETHNENREKQFSCEHCETKFYSKQLKDTHVLRRHSSRQFICDLCKFPFQYKGALRNHIRQHYKRKEQCMICKKKFSQKYSLELHMRTHTGDKPYQCKDCPKSFANSIHLVNHHRVHTGERPHKCGVCAKCFTQRGTLVRHMRTHDDTTAKFSTPSRPHKCKSCWKDFAKEVMLWRHMKIHEKDTDCDLKRARSAGKNSRRKK